MGNQRNTGSGVAVRSGALVNGARGRFSATAVLTEQQAAFVRFFVAKGGNALQAAKEAGYSHPRSEGWRLTNIPQVRAAIRAEQERVVQCDLGSVAWETLRGIMTDKEAPASARVAACRATLEASGWFARQNGTALDDRPLSELSVKELEFIALHGVVKLQDEASPSAILEAEAVVVEADGVIE